MNEPSAAIYIYNANYNRAAAATTTEDITKGFSSGGGGGRIKLAFKTWPLG